MHVMKKTSHKTCNKKGFVHFVVNGKGKWQNPFARSEILRRSYNRVYTGGTPAVKHNINVFLWIQVYCKQYSSHFGFWA